MSTLMFEDIPESDTLINKDTIARYPARRHVNASKAYKRIAYRKGRYGQTQGNVLGDINNSVPACPYHMPRDSMRFESPRFHLSKKNPGDIINASDINNLIDRIKAFQYAWEAESKNLYGYNIIASAPSVNIATDKLNYILPSGTTEPNLILNDSHFNGNIEIYVPKEEHLSCKVVEAGKPLSEVQTALINDYNNKVKTYVKYNNQIPCGFPSVLDDVLTGTDGVWDENITFNAGQQPLYSVKYIQFKESNGQISDNYKLMYIDGDRFGEIVKDKNQVEIIFKPNTIYTISYRKDNQPDTKLSYAGFILYFIETFTNSTITKTVTTYEPQSYGITYKWSQKFVSKLGPYYGDWVNDQQTFINYIPEINISLKNYAKNISPEKSFWNDITEGNVSGHNTNPVEILKFLNDNNFDIIHIPAQKVENGKYYYKNSSNKWVQSNGIYNVKSFNFVTKTWQTYDSVNKKYIDHSCSGIDIDIVKSTILTNTWQYSERSTVLGNTDGSFSLDNRIFNDFMTFSMLDDVNDTTPRKLGSGTINYIEICTGNFGQGWDFASDGTMLEQRFNEDGIQTYWPVKDYYYLGLGCPEGSTLENGVCKVTTDITLSTSARLIRETTSGYYFNEPGITYTKDRKYLGFDLYPTIKAEDYKSIKTTLKGYLDTILSVAQTGINDGRIDSTTSTEINQFYTTNAQQDTVFNPDDPDDSFLGYHAAKGGIIKVNFYNSLVEAYKIMVNGCICNADCACNLVCICNTNCGCNYSG
mgnify:CR=1 FL=1